ncbi:MAG: MFS transporter [Pyrinomonadaceae bacterium]|nr:MFS transporter [Pyrinomonadaceae bacterium]
MSQELSSQELKKDVARRGFNLNSPLTIIFITVLIDLIGFGIVIPVLPIYSAEFGASATTIGLLVASYSIMQFIFTPILGQLSDRYGRRPILFFSLLGTSLGFLILGLANTLFLLFLGRILDGITGGNISTAQAYIADVTTIENRAKGMGLLGAAFGLGFVLGPLIGGVLSKYGVHVPFYFAAAMALANAILLYFVLPESLKKENRQPRKMQSRWRLLVDAVADSQMAMVIALYFLVITAFSMMTTAFSIYTLYRFGYNAENNGYLFGFIGILAVIFQLGFFPKLTKAFGEAKLITVGAIIMSVAFILVPFVSPETFGFITSYVTGNQFLSSWLPNQIGGLMALLLGIAAFSIGNSMATPSLTSLGSKLSPPEKQGTSLGILQSSASLARAVGPAFAGILLYSASATNDIQVDDGSLFRMFWTAAAIIVGAFLLSLFFGRVRNEKYDLIKES